MTIQSPCVNVCRLAPAGVCAGCWRTAAEIGRWRDADEAERLAILRNIEDRKRAASANDRR